MIEQFFFSLVIFLLTIIMISRLNLDYYERLFKDKMLFAVITAIVISLLITGITEWLFRIYEGVVSLNRIFVCMGYVGGIAWVMILYFRRNK